MAGRLGRLSALVQRRILLLLLVPCCIEVSSGMFLEPGVHEYCPWDLFNATCPDSSLVLMNSARYGRMRLGKCIDTDFGIGCSADVLQLVDARCSGRPVCIIPLPDNTLHHQQPCNKDMLSYLEASYTCITASDAGTKSCPEAGSVHLRQEEGYLSTHSAQTLRLGTALCPWVITVKAGQKVRLTVLDFSMTSRYKSDTVQPSVSHAENSKILAEYCHLYATVLEPSRAVRQTICAENAREFVAYTSISNSVSIELSEQVVDDQSISFIIKFSVTGCADFEPPKNSWTERSGDRITVRCNQTSQSWHMVCKGVSWIGQASECQEDYPVGEKVVDDSHFPTYGLVIAVIIGVFVGSFCGFLLLAIVLWCKRQASPRCDPEVELVAPSGDSDHVCKVHRLPTGEYGYTHVWEVRNTQLPMPLGGMSLQRSSGDSRSMSTQDSAYQTSAGDQSLIAEPPSSGLRLPGSAAAAAVHARKEHVYECPIFDERFLLQRLQNYPHHCPHEGVGLQRQVFCPHGRGGFASPAVSAVDQGRPGVASPTDRVATASPLGSACTQPTAEDNADEDKARSNFAKSHGYTPVFSAPDQEQGCKPTKATENHYL